jgi:hypothetical protein
MSPDLCRQDIKKLFFTHSISAKPLQRLKNRRLSQFLTNFGKKISRRQLKSQAVFTLTLPTTFTIAGFLQQVSKVKKRDQK